MLTLLSAPKPFRGHIGVIQTNAITSWLRLSPPCEVVLFGDDEGVADAAQRTGARHVPQVARNQYGTPILSDVFDQGAALAGTDHGLALEPGRVLCQHAVEVGGDPPGEGQPVGHSSKGEKTSPLVSLGKKYVVFSGRSSPARATDITCSSVGARTRKAASARPLRTASSAATALGV